MSIQPRKNVEIVTTYHGDVIITYQLVNKRIEGLACARFHDHVFYYNYKNGIKEGPAIKKFNDGSYIKFNYKQNVAQGPVLKVLTDGSLILLGMIFPP